MFDLDTTYVYRSKKGWRDQLIEVLDHEPNEKGLVSAVFVSGNDFFPSRSKPQQVNAKRIRGTVGEREAAEKASQDARPTITYTTNNGTHKSVRDYGMTYDDAIILDQCEGEIAFTENGVRASVPLSAIKIEKYEADCELCGCHVSVSANFASPISGEKFKVYLYDS